MDSMEFMVQQPEAAMAQPQHFHGLQRQQHQGCPYYQQHHQSGLPPPFVSDHHPHSHAHVHAHAHAHSRSHSHPNNYPIPHQQPSSPNRNLSQEYHHHQQQQQHQHQHQHQQQHQHQHQHQQQQQQQQQPPPRPQQPSLPHPHPHPHPHPQPYGHSHAHYDPVHSASSSWNQHQGPTSAFQWPGPFAAPLGHNNRLPVPDQLYFTSGAGVPTGAGQGPVQPPLIPPPHHDSWAVQLPSYRRPPATTRFHSTVPQQNNPNTGPSHSQSNNTMDAVQGGGGSLQPSRGISLPSLNPNPNPTPPLPQPTPATASTSGESGSAVLPPSSRPPLFTAPDNSSRPQDRGSGNGSSSPPSSSSSSTSSLSSSSSSTAIPPPQLPRPPLFGAMEPLQRIDIPPGPNSAHPAPESDRPLFPINPAMPHGPDRRRYYTTSRRVPRPPIPTSVSQHSDYDSDEDLEQLMDDADDQTLHHYIEEFSAGNPQFRALTEDHVRASQILRGQISNKRVASRKALSQLQSVDLNTLPESERTCVICYNDFGVPNPEGINEAPLRLPGCKHIFGDHCIKKWFEESDSCPYCRDKVHSEPVFPPSYRAIHNMLRSSFLRNRPAPDSGTSTFGDEEALARLMTQDRDAARLMAHQDRGPDGAPPRTFQTGERRSPPSEASENRRRTRARHGSFRASLPAGPLAGRTPASHTAGGPAPPQHSPPRERSTSGSQRPFFTPMMNMGPRPNFFQHMEPQGVGPNSMPLGPGTLNHSFNNPPYSVPGNGGQAGAASTQPPAYSTGPQQAATFSQQLPPVMAPQQPFAVPSNVATGPPGTVGGEGMLQ
ncbi:hypothetical protein MFIFM68171_01606 [Madurella fahalii]|uniref:RING-type domain-containing protein n=1 Tax=Madurella fahalii TaxID=1157608 RepID=A0ABQ0G0W6_9PEZI